MSAAPVETPESLPPLPPPSEREADAARLVRLFELRYWLRGIGCCWRCSLRYALAQVEREAGAKFDPGGECAEPENDCKAKARAQWSSMPANPKRATL